MNFYQGDLTKLSDLELATLCTEIEDCGVLEKEYDACDEWEEQARERYWSMDSEQRRRWEAANPEEAERRRQRSKPLTDLVSIAVEHNRERMLNLFEDKYGLRDLLR